MDYSIITNYIKEQWRKLTVEYILYLIVFWIILSYIIGYFLNPKQLKWFYYIIFIMPFIGLIFGISTDSLPDIFYKNVII